MLNNILKSNAVYGFIFLLFPAYTWSKFFRIWLKLRKKLNDHKLFYIRHNCVIMFDNKRGITGWPSNSAFYNKSLTNLNIYEPILYFIQTAQKSLDVAVMVVNNNTVVNALIKAHRRGISIRLLLDYNYCRNANSKDLEKSGIQVLYYVCPDQNLSSIMHYKYMLKDYSNGNGYLYTGSQNWTNVAFQEYYENTIFTTNQSVVEAVHNNFVQTWNYVNDLCKTNSYVKARLKGVQ